MKIIIDAMGGDNAPYEIVKGAVMASEEFGVDIVLTGRGEEILKSLHDLGKKDLPKGIEIANAAEVITMEDDPANATRSKPDSSMTVALKLLRDGSGDAVVSAGSTGALLSGATLIVKRIKGIRRAALAPSLPGKKGKVLLLDCGANVECTPEYLLQFAFMGSYYVKLATGNNDPRIGLLNIGAEETKGDELHKQAYKMLKAAGDAGRINFVGNVESRDALSGVCDVLVTDGFSGNILLKGIEGIGSYIFSEIKGVFMKSFLTKLAAALVKNNMKELKKKMDASEVGGTSLLGISKPVIKAHGSSDAYAVRSAVRQAIDAVNADVAKAISENIEYMKIAPAEQ